VTYEDIEDKWMNKCGADREHFDCTVLNDEEFSDPPLAVERFVVKSWWFRLILNTLQKSRMIRTLLVVKFVYRGRGSQGDIYGQSYTTKKHGIKDENLRKEIPNIVNCSMNSCRIGRSGTKTRP
jgi:hypothetical protein